LSFSEFLIAVSEAWALLAAHPLQWLAVVAVFLVVVESLMFIPYFGFVLKLSVAGVVVGQIVAMFSAAARVQQSPSPRDLIAAFDLPWPTQAPLAVAVVLPFILATLYLYQRAGVPATRFFFGNIFRTKPPTKALLLEFKYAMQIFALPFSLVAGAVMLKGLSGWVALSVAVSAALVNWVPVLVLGLLALAFEWISMQLTSVLPKAAAASIGILLMVAFMAWSFAVMYTVSARVFMA
jgi:hypothetical protein